jgi:hypothetical protein
MSREKKFIKRNFDFLNYCVIKTIQKTNKRVMARTILGETKRGRPKKGQNMHNPKGPKKRKRSSFFCGRKLFHP